MQMDNSVNSGTHDLNNKVAHCHRNERYTTRYVVFSKSIFGNGCEGGRERDSRTKLEVGLGKSEMLDSYLY